MYLYIYKITISCNILQLLWTECVQVFWRKILSCFKVSSMSLEFNIKNNYKLVTLKPYTSKFKKESFQVIPFINLGRFSHTSIVTTMHQL